MKKLTKVWIPKSILLFVVCLICVSCVDGERDIKYYKFKNESGSNLKIKFYSDYKFLEGYDSLIVDNESYSKEFYTCTGVPERVFFIFYVDSIDFISSEILMKRIRKSDGIVNKTPFVQKYFDKQIIVDKNRTINIYTILKEDFEN